MTSEINKTDKGTATASVSEKKNSDLNLGETLRAAREREAMTVTSLASELFLPVRTIEALENNEFDALPEPAYVRGYIRNYAKATGLDAQMLEQQFNRLNLKSPEFEPSNVNRPANQQILSPRTIRSAMWIASIVLMVAMVWWGLRPSESPDWLVQLSEDEQPTSETLLFESQSVSAEPVKYQTRKIRSDTESVSIAELKIEDTRNATLVETDTNKSPDTLPTKQVVEKQSVPEVAQVRRDLPVKSTPSISRKALPEITEQPTLSFEQAIADVSPTEDVEELTPVQIIGSETSLIPAYGNDRLQLRYKNQSWTEIRDAENKILLHGLVHTGETRTLEGKAPFNVFLGNSPAVDLVINGLPFDQTDYNRSNKTARFSVVEPAL